MKDNYKICYFSDNIDIFEVIQIIESNLNKIFIFHES